MKNTLIAVYEYLRLSVKEWSVNPLMSAVSFYICLSLFVVGYHVTNYGFHHYWVWLSAFVFSAFPAFLVFIVLSFVREDND